MSTKIAKGVGNAIVTNGDFRDGDTWVRVNDRGEVEPCEFNDPKCIGVVRREAPSPTDDSP